MPIQYNKETHVFTVTEILNPLRFIYQLTRRIYDFESLLNRIYNRDGALLNKQVVSLSTPEKSITVVFLEDTWSITRHEVTSPYVIMRTTKYRFDTIDVQQPIPMEI